MKTFQLKINMANLKNEIDKDYFKYKDIFYKCLIGNLTLSNIHVKEVTGTAILDDSYYNQYFLYAAANNITVKRILEEIASPYNISIFLDTNMYYEEFIRSRHSDKHINLYSIQIDDLYNVLVTIKWLPKHVN